MDMSEMICKCGWEAPDGVVLMIKQGTPEDVQKQFEFVEALNLHTIIECPKCKANMIRPLFALFCEPEVAPKEGVGGFDKHTIIEVCGCSEDERRSGHNIDCALQKAREMH